MDMKKILQAMDGVSTKPVEGASDMSKFMSIVTEGANPHKVALPVQMAMQHYSKPVGKKQPKTSMIGKYFAEAEEAINAKQEEKKTHLRQYASMIAERVRLKESKSVKKQVNEENEIVPVENPTDEITVDVPLLIRLLEYAREDAQTDMDLHNVAENLISLSAEGRTLSMADYDSIINSEAELDERSVSQAQAHMMAAAAHNPAFAKKVKINPSVAKEFNRADKGKNIKGLPQRVQKNK
jgi:hypothetical protein